MVGTHNCSAWPSMSLTSLSDNASCTLPPVLQLSFSNGATICTSTSQPSMRVPSLLKNAFATRNNCWPMTAHGQDEHFFVCSSAPLFFFFYFKELVHNDFQLLFNN